MGSKRGVQIRNYTVIMSNLESEPAKFNMPSLRDPAKNLNLLTSGFFWWKFLWKFNCKHMPGEKEMLKHIDQSVRYIKFTRNLPQFSSENAVREEVYNHPQSKHDSRASSRSPSKELRSVPAPFTMLLFSFFPSLSTRWCYLHSSRRDVCCMFVCERERAAAEN